MKKKILISWELGNNSGHIARALGLALKLRDAGVDVVWTIPEQKYELDLQRYGFDAVLAPKSDKTPSPVHPISYASILNNVGFCDPDILEQKTQEWCRIFAHQGISAIIYNHSPTALLAARIVGIPVLLLGNGFDLPPVVSPLPGLNPFMENAHEDLVEADQRVTSCVNLLLAKHKKNAISCVADLFSGRRAYLVGYRELDPFSSCRSLPVYLGRVRQETDMAPLPWRSCTENHVFAYLRMSMLGIVYILKALNQFEGEVICYLPDAPPHLARQYPNIRFLSEMTDLSLLLREATLCVSYGGSGFVAESLCHGVPLLLIPCFLEQLLTSLCVESLGAGIILNQNRSFNLISSSLNELASQPLYKERAIDFSRQTVSSVPSPGDAIDLLADVLDHMVSAHEA